MLAQEPRRDLGDAVIAGVLLGGELQRRQLAAELAMCGQPVRVYRQRPIVVRIAHDRVDQLLLDLRLVGRDHHSTGRRARSFGCGSRSSILFRPASRASSSARRCSRSVDGRARCGKRVGSRSTAPSGRYWSMTLT